MLRGKCLPLLLDEIGCEESELHLLTCRTAHFRALAEPITHEPVGLAFQVSRDRAKACLGLASAPIISGHLIQILVGGRNHSDEA